MKFKSYAKIDITYRFNTMLKIFVWLFFNYMVKKKLLLVKYLNIWIIKKFTYVGNKLFSKCLINPLNFKKSEMELKWVQHGMEKSMIKNGNQKKYEF